MNITGLDEVEGWSFEEFGHAVLGNGKRTKRLVAMARGTAERAAGKVTEVFKSVAEREGAYKFLENDKIAASSVAKAAHIACAKRCADETFVFVPTDGSTLSISDDAGLKGLGPVGPKGTGSGLEAMTAIAVRSDGTPLGICGQEFWVREKGKKVKHTRTTRKMKEKETRYWLDVIEQTEGVFSEFGGKCRPWYQLDRGGDFREMLIWANRTTSLITVRAAQDRLVEDPEARLLWESLEKRPLLGIYELPVSAQQKRKARTASIHVRAGKIKILVCDEETKKRVSVELTAVLAQEVGTTPEGEKPIEWLLLSNYAATTFEDARKVIFGYAQRWKVEEFHKSWKSVCGVEKIQLREFSNIKKMAVLLASVAIRVERLKYLARRSPYLPATVELTQIEIDALIILQKPKGYKRGQIPSIGEAVRWIADLGGYTGQSSGGPPGTIVIGRGLSRLESAARIVKEMT